MLTPDLAGHTANSWFCRPSPPKYSLPPYFLENDQTSLWSPVRLCDVSPPHVGRSSVPVRRHLHVVLDDDEDLSVPPGPGLGPGSHDPEVLSLLLDDLFSVAESEFLCHLPNQISL